MEFSKLRTTVRTRLAPGQSKGNPLAAYTWVSIYYCQACDKPGDWENVGVLEGKVIQQYKLCSKCISLLKEEKVS